MRSQDPETLPSADARLTQSTVRRMIAKSAAVIAADFLALTIVGPELIDLHQDLALAGALFCFAGAFAATVWLTIELRRDLRRLQQGRRELTRSIH